MCTIISIQGDRTTDDVIDWVHALKGNVNRFNVSNDIESNSLFIDLSQSKDTINREKGWIRKTGFFKELDSYTKMYENESFTIVNHVYSEFVNLREFLCTENIDWINSPESFFISKIEILKKCIQYNVDIPDTFLINTRESVFKLFHKFKEGIIIKPITDIAFFKKDNKVYSSYTYKLTIEDINKIPPLFFPSQVQRYIEKEFEIRSFYFNQQFFSSAIFSQSDKQTRTDFRNYNLQRPNRIVPYRLPVKFEKKLIRLFKNLNIYTGSIDIIKGIDGKFYFLEINQGGQFGMISKPCNLKLEKLVAQSLI